MTKARIKQSMWLNQRFELPEEHLDNIVIGYQQAWLGRGDQYIAGLEQVSGLKFALNIIDVYIANAKSQQIISDPLIIGGGFSAQEFVYVLVHEIAHVLADDNTSGINWHDLARDAYNKYDWYVADHILVYAMIDALFTEVIKNTDPLIWFAVNYKKYPRGEDHDAAWQIVTEKGYEEILSKVRKLHHATEDKIVQKTR